jgi:hypothetical protein
MQRRLSVSAVLVVLLLTYQVASSKSHKPVKSTTPLSADEIAIYKAVLRSYTGDKDANLNVAATTYPLDPDASTTGFDQSECLNGVTLENLASASSSYHELPADVLPAKGMRLVDPKKQARIVHSNDPSDTIRKGEPVKSAVEAAFSTGLFSMSEIAFDKQHHFAAVRYSFWCGSLCGHGRTLVFENVNGKWQNANRNCGNWIS